MEFYCFQTDIKILPTEHPRIIYNIEKLLCGEYRMKYLLRFVKADHIEDKPFFRSCLPVIAYKMHILRSYMHYGTHSAQKHP